MRGGRRGLFHFRLADRALVHYLATLEDEQAAQAPWVAVDPGHECGDSIEMLGGHTGENHKKDQGDRGFYC